MNRVVFLEGRRLSEAQVAAIEPLLQQYHRGELTKMAFTTRVKLALQKAKLPLENKELEDEEA